MSVYACITGICTCFIQGGQQQRGAGVCLVQCSGQRRSTQPSSIIFDINKFLIGLQWGKEQQLQQSRTAGQRVDDDTNRSISSIEDDFLTASEHLGDDSEDDGFRNGEPHYLHQREFVFGCVCVLWVGRMSQKLLEMKAKEEVICFWFWYKSASQYLIIIKILFCWISWQFLLEPLCLSERKYTNVLHDCLLLCIFS